MDLAGRSVRGSMTVHYVHKATYESWRSKEYGCQIRCWGFLLLRRANLSTQARNAIITLAGNSLSLSNVMKACKRYADEFYEIPRNTIHVGHTLSLCRGQERQVLGQKNRKETLM